MKPYFSLKRSANSVSYCHKEQKKCVWWVEKYFKDCLCNLNDDFSFGFGLISLLAWGVAEVPQIITNFRTKSGHGVSLLFLLTWVAGDIFNLVGCLLEPATLPTQYYTALLYTISTLVLVFQSLYYDYVRKWRKCRHNYHQEVEEEKPLNQKPTVPSVPIPNASRPTRVRREFYYTSARSLAGSHTPPSGFNFLRPARSGPSAVALLDHSSSDDDDSTTTPNSTKKAAATRPMPIPRSKKFCGKTYAWILSVFGEHKDQVEVDRVELVVARGTMISATMSLPVRGKAMAELYIGFTGRRLLHEGHVEHNAMGQWLGWLMAAIYMGGRIPQIILNIKRGSVEGMNPLMFIFALIANVTYVLSIVVRSTEWSKIKANMPWLLDAVVCVALDLFIIVQYVYYKHLRKKEAFVDDEDNRDFYIQAEK